MTEARGSTDVLLAGILQELQHLRQDIRQALDRNDGRSSLSRGDREKLTALLPAIAGALGSELFTSRELLEHDSPALHLVLSGQSAKQVGKLLRRADGQPVGGHLVRCEGSEVNVALWRCLAC